MAHLAKMASLCRLCGSYGHHRVALFGKKASQERLASRISAVLDITLNDDDGLPNLMCAKCKRRVESLENHTWDRKSLKGLRNRLLKIRTFITRHYIILTSLLYRVRTLTSHDTEESENSPESPHLGEIKRMRKQCVPGASPFFARAGDEATVVAVHVLMLRTDLYVYSTTVQFSVSGYGDITIIVVLK